MINPFLKPVKLINSYFQKLAEKHNKKMTDLLACKEFPGIKTENIGKVTNMDSDD